MGVRSAIVTMVENCFVNPPSQNSAIRILQSAFLNAPCRAPSPVLQVKDNDDSSLYYPVRTEYTTARYFFQPAANLR
jgi:hypothetical protein